MTGHELFGRRSGCPRNCVWCVCVMHFQDQVTSSNGKADPAGVKEEEPPFPFRIFLFAFMVGRVVDSLEPMHTLCLY